MGLRMLALALLVACEPTTVTPFTPLGDGDPSDDMGRVDLVLEGVGFTGFEGAVLWTEVLEAESPAMPAEVTEGELFVLLPSSYVPRSAIFLTVSIVVDFDHDTVCGPGDLQIYAPATILAEEDPAFAWMDLNDPDAMFIPCD